MIASLLKQNVSYSTSVHLFLVLVFSIGTLESVHASEAYELSRTEKQALTVVKQEPISPEKTILYYGRKKRFPQPDEVIGECSVTKEYEDASKRTFKAEAGIAGLGEVGGEYSQENAIVKLKGIAPKVSDLEDRLSAVCIQYWQGVLDRSLTPIPRMRASIREAPPST
jgi:hypothetical protein